MDKIDYEALGRVADDSYCNPDHTIADCARAVVAALREQGFAVVLRDDLNIVWGELVDSLVNEDGEWRTNAHPSFLAVMERVGAVLVAAPGNAEGVPMPRPEAIERYGSEEAATIMAMVIDYCTTTLAGRSRDERNEAGDRVAAAITALVRERDRMRPVVEAVENTAGKLPPEVYAAIQAYRAATAPPDGGQEG